MDKSHKILIAKKKYVATNWNGGYIKMQLTWHHHFVTNFMTQPCSHIIYVYLNIHELDIQKLLLFINLHFILLLISLIQHVPY